jgi:hypothetical protein
VRELERETLGIGRVRFSFSASERTATRAGLAPGPHGRAGRLGFGRGVGVRRPAGFKPMRPLPCASPVRLVRALVRCRRLSANGAQAGFGGWRARGRGKGQCHIRGTCAAPVSRFTAASLEGGAAGSIASGVVGPTRQSRHCHWRGWSGRERQALTRAVCRLAVGSAQ